MPGVPVLCDFCGERGEYGGRVFMSCGSRFWCRRCGPIARSYCEQATVEEAERLRLIWRLCRLLRRRAHRAYLLLPAGVR